MFLIPLLSQANLLSTNVTGSINLAKQDHLMTFSMRLQWMGELFISLNNHFLQFKPLYPHSEPEHISAYFHRGTKMISCLQMHKQSKC